MNLESDKDIYFYLSRGYSIKKKVRILRNSVLLLFSVLGLSSGQNQNCGTHYFNLSMNNQTKKTKSDI